MAPHCASGKTVPVVVRFSNGTDVPALPDADPNASPHGIAIRFNLPEGVNTDIVSISSNGFPVATPEEFVALLQAIGQSGPGATKPTPVEQFMGSHPIALKWATLPRPAPGACQLRQLGVLRRQRIQVHQRNGAEPIRALPDLAGGRKLKGESQDLLPDCATQRVPGWAGRRVSPSIGRRHSAGVGASRRQLPGRK